MLRKTPLKAKKVSLKKTPLKAGNGFLRSNSSLNKTSTLKAKTPLKKQNEEAKRKWEEIRQKVLERDKYKCIVCGKPATQVHHIHLRSKRRDLLYEMNNLVAICDEHHQHSSTEGLEKVNKRIAQALHLTLEELLAFAEKKDN